MHLGGQSPSPTPRPLPLTFETNFFEDNEIYFLLAAAKFGVDPAGCLDLVKHVSLGCPNLEFCGLMTIGMLDYTSTPENFKVD